MSVEFNIPGYDIIKLLGEGGMSRVYLAKQCSLDRTVILKILSPGAGSDNDFEARFLREARSLAKLSHKNIMAVYEAGIADGLHYFAAEYLSGGDLSWKIRSGKLDVETAVNVVMAVANALEFAHSHGFIHRDVKPGNILFRDDGTPVLADFGIARTVNSDITVVDAGLAIGTPSYMSPEQLRGEPLDGQSDLYSLGVVFYEMLTGSRPYIDDSPYSLASRHINDPVPQLPPALEVFQAVIDGLMAKTPDKRLANAGALVYVLDESASSFLHSDTSERDTSYAGASTWGSGGPGDGRLAFPDAADSGPVKRDVLAASKGLFHRLFSWGGSGCKYGSASVGKDAQQPDNIKKNRRADNPDNDKTVIISIDESQKYSSDETPVDQDSLNDQTMFFPAQAPEDSEIPVELTIISSPVQHTVGDRISIEKTPFNIGRDSAADLCIPVQNISRVHCRILCTDEGYCIQDNDSTNGVFVNGRKISIENAEPLMFGDMINLSNEAVLRFKANIEELPDLSGEVFNERYELKQLLHTSIKASTYIARDTNLPRQVAIKIFSPILARIPRYSRMFKQQAEVAESLPHPHIDSVLDTGNALITYSGRQTTVQYLCMKEKTANLSGKLREETVIELKQALEWLGMIGSALSFAHAEGFVHCDLKPSAIVFDRQNFPYVADFSLACMDGEDSGAAFMGSAAYMAPEQWDNASLSPASDQYSLAVLAYQMLSGSLPFEGQADPEVRRRNYMRPPIPVHEEAARNNVDNIPYAVSEVLEKALSQSPADRFESVASFMEVLFHAIDKKINRGKPKVFISYHRETSAGWVVLLERELREKFDIDTYVDTNAIDQAARFPDRLSEAIVNSDVVVCLLGEKTFDSAWVREEIRIANERQKPMIPVFQEDFDRKAAGGDDLPVCLQSLLNYDGVYLLNKRNIHIDHTISDIARIVNNTFMQ